MAHIRTQTIISTEAFNFSICDLNLVMLNIFMSYTSHLFLSCLNLQHTSCKHVFSIRMENSVDPDQMATSEAR